MSKYTRKLKEQISVPVTHFLSRGDFFLNGRQRVLRTSNDPVLKTLLHRSSVVIQGGWRTTKARLHSGQQQKNRTKGKKNLSWLQKTGSTERTENSETNSAEPFIEERILLVEQDGFGQARQQLWYVHRNYLGNHLGEADLGGQ